jgi:hypothetical protein
MIIELIFILTFLSALASRSVQIEKNGWGSRIPLLREGRAVQIGFQATGGIQAGRGPHAFRPYTERRFTTVVMAAEIPLLREGGVDAT